MHAWQELAEFQCGVLTRAQLLESEMTRSQIGWQVTSGRWQRLGPGVYLTHTGPVPETARLWAAVLKAGPGAVAGPASTLWLHGLLVPLRWAGRRTSSTWCSGSCSGG